MAAAKLHALSKHIAKIDGTQIRKWLQRTFSIALPIVAAVLVGLKFREVEWAEVGAALVGYGPSTIVAAFVMALPAFAACAGYDLIGRHIVGHRLTASRTMLISFSGYYFSLNLGALVGGLAVRYRLYLPYGFSLMKISQIVALSVLTNWLGFILVAAVVLMAAPSDMFSAWPVNAAAGRAIGAAAVVSIVAYLACCWFLGGTSITIRNSAIKLPGAGIACLQLLLSVLNWGAIGAIITWLLPADITWFMVMPVLMTSALAGIWSHIPGGLGVTEAIFVTMLESHAEQGAILAAIVTFRVIYYLLPFCVALCAFALLETTSRSHDVSGE